MEKLIMYRTSDGKLHERATAAERHARARHADALMPLAHAIVRDAGYRGDLAAAWLMENRAALLAMYALADDMQLPAEPET